MASFMSPDSQVMSLKIIDAIKQHPVLYINDVKGVDMKLQDFRHKVWQYIADDLKLDVNWMKTRWKNLRDTYCRIVKYKNKPDKGARRKKWIYEDHLNFLAFPFEPNYEHQTCEVTEEYLELINSNNLSSEGLLEQLEDKIDEDYTEFLEVVQKPGPTTSKESTSERIIVPTSENINEIDKDLLVQQIEAKFRKIRPKGTEMQIMQASSFNANILPVSEASLIAATEIEPPKKKRRVKNNLQNNSVDEIKNSLELFFDSMAKTVKKFPQDLQTDIKYNICKIIAEAESKSNKEITLKKLDPVYTLPKLLLIPCHMIDKVK